ncbi:MAG: aldehyde dehydrogenase family protein, partial [Rhodanobacter sp.]
MTFSSKLLIDGALVEGDRTIDVIDPANGRPFATVACASQAQAERAIQAAKAAQPAWEAAGWSHRASLLARYADALAARAAEFADIMVREQGKPLAEAKAEVGYTIDFVRYFAGVLPHEQQLDTADTSRATLFRKALGVVVGISPWNFPLLIPAAKLAPALLTGNTIVLKPAPTTPISTLLLGEVANDIFPRGVLNVITDQNDLGDFLTSHADVAKVTFTGSTATGRKIMASAAPTLKRVSLELGGNDAAIVLKDVDVIDTAQKIFDASFFNTGQACLAIKRVYVATEIYDAFCDAMAGHARNARMGSGADESTRIGPLQNRQQFEKAKHYLEVARTDGVIIAGGGYRNDAGYFVEPTIVRDIDDASALVADEQFSPILPIVRVRDGDDALRRANHSEFGLAGSVWSADVTAARALARQMQAGTVWINQHLNFGPTIPLAGAKQSGLGVEWGELGVEEFGQVSVINEAVAA